MFIFGLCTAFFIVFCYKTITANQRAQEEENYKIVLKTKMRDAEDEIRSIKIEANKILANAEKKLAAAEKEIERSKIVVMKTEETARKAAEKISEKEMARVTKERIKLESDINKSQIASNEAQLLYFEKMAYHMALEEVTNLWINTSFESIIDSLNATNYATQQSKLVKIFEKCDKLGLDINFKDIERFEETLKEQHVAEVSNLKAKEEQARIKEIMKEEQRAEKFRNEELKKIESEKQAIEKKKIENEEKMKFLTELENLKNMTREQQEELENLKLEHSKIEEELASKERAKSMAEMTKAGHVYIISNIGSFGEGVYKVGMTRRLIPEDRVKELGDASVPFPFDVHMMIPSEDAPRLESLLHEELWNFRMNYVNNHKEFFKVDFQEIKAVISKNCVEGTYICIDDPKAPQWRETLKMKELGQNTNYTPHVELDEESEEDAA